METMASRSIGSFVTEDYRTAAVFQKYGIDFCCNGGKTIDEACRKKNISPEQLLGELDSVSKESSDSLTDYASWPLDLLADYIEKKHHRYIVQTTPAIRQFLDKVCKVHGNHDKELYEINEEFNAAADELEAHMRKEEMILFPYIRAMAKARDNREHAGQPGFGSVQNPIQMMRREHDVEGGRFHRISELSRGYTPPEYACNTYKVVYSLLKEFEQDLHLHIHLENNILFPGAIELEQELE